MVCVLLLAFDAPYNLHIIGYYSFTKCTHHRSSKQILVQVASPIAPVPHHRLDHSTPYAKRLPNLSKFPRFTASIPFYPPIDPSLHSRRNVFVTISRKVLFLVICDLRLYCFICALPRLVAWSPRSLRLPLLHSRIGSYVRRLSIVNEAWLSIACTCRRFLSIT